MDKRNYIVVDIMGNVYGHDLDYAHADQIIASLSPEIIKEKEIEIIEN